MKIRSSLAISVVVLVGCSTGEIPSQSPIAGKDRHFDSTDAPIDEGHQWPIQTSEREFVQHWTLEKLRPEIDVLETLDRDIARGKLIFVLECLHCHRINGVGSDSGPDLSDLSRRMTVEQIVRATLEPSVEINKDYQMQMIELLDGRIVTGLIAKQTASEIWLIEDARFGSRYTKIRTTEIEVQRPSATSAMPSGSLDTYSREEVLDFFAFVCSDGETVSK